jgi:FKBP-type peptidyl-prolyl cis-trans isomerase
MHRVTVVSIWCCLTIASVPAAQCIAAPSGSPGAPAAHGAASDPPPNAVTTASGLRMIVLINGSGKARPMPNDCVKLRFIARAVDGAVVARSPEDGAPTTECVRRLAPPIQEAVAAMLQREQRRVWVPARPRSAADGPSAPSNSVDLIYEITLVEIIKAPPTPTPLKRAPASARKLASGVAIQVLVKGSGKVHPGPNSRVTLHQSSWTTDGALFESTTMAGHPATYAVSDLIPGVRDGVEELVVGSRARLWIPAQRAYGEKPQRRGQPAGPLVYEVELLSIE